MSVLGWFQFIDSFFSFCNFKLLCIAGNVCLHSSLVNFTLLDAGNFCIPKNFLNFILECDKVTWKEFDNFCVLLLRLIRWNQGSAQCRGNYSMLPVGNRYCSWPSVSNENYSF